MSVLVTKKHVRGMSMEAMLKKQYCPKACWRLPTLLTTHAKRDVWQRTVLSVCQPTLISDLEEFRYSERYYLPSTHSVNVCDVRYTRG